MASRRPFGGDDEAFTPLQALVILIVAFLVATVTAYAWTNAFDEESEDPLRAKPAAQAHSFDARGSWIELFLERTEAPIDAGEVSVQLRGVEGERVGRICDSPHLDAQTRACLEPFEREWSRQNALWVPCQWRGSHVVIVLVRDDPLLQKRTDCSSPAKLAPAGAAS